MYGDSGFTDETGAGGYAGSSGGDWIGAVIGAGAGLYDSHQNRKASKENTMRTIDANKREAELAYQRQVEMWNMENLYNSPEAQMGRFNKAGLNPHLIYGNGSAASGNSSGFPEYQPARVQYDIQAAKYGAPIASILPTLMAVGSWMQNMRLTEAELKAKQVGMERTETDTERLRQMIDFLVEKNPQILRSGQQQYEIGQYQKDTQMFGRDKARQTLFEMEQKFRNNYGQGLFEDMGSAFQPRGDGKFAPIGGLQKLKFLQEESNTKLKQAQASWADMDITNPQAIMMMVLNGVMGMAGASMRMRAPGKGPQINNARPTGVRRRVHPSRRVASKPKGYYD